MMPIVKSEVKTQLKNLSVRSIHMATVTQRVKQVKQPRGGYFKMNIITL